MFCPSCGTENPDESRFCRNCGSAFPERGVEQLSQAQQAVQPLQTDYSQQVKVEQVVQNVQQPAAQSQQQAPVQQPATPQIIAPTITPPQMAAAAVNGTPSYGEAALAQDPTRKRLKIILIAVAAVAIICVVMLLVNLLGGGSTRADNSHRLDTSYVVDSSGKKIDLFTRPVLATLQDVDSAMVAAPGLAAYDEDFMAQSGATTAQVGNTTVVLASGDDEPEVTNNQEDAAGPEVASGLSNVTNLSDFYLSDNVKKILEENMFAVDARSGDLEFYDVYEMNRYEELASFITTDSIMHTYHLYFSHLLKNLEADYLSASLLNLTNSMLEKSFSQQQELAGTEWESAANRNVVFFATAQKLLDPNAQPPSSVASQVNNEYNQILAASGQGKSTITGAQEDYSQYKPRGYYEGDEKLERYFRAMMLYGRTHFLQNDSFNSDADDLNRSALLMNLALDDGTHAAANKDWESIYTITSFFAGASDDNGFYEYYPLILAAYGSDVTVADLAGNTSGWEMYKDLTSKVEPPQISSIIVGDEEQSTQDSIKGFRFMGQRFSLDESIFQQLIHDNVPERLLPSALDVPVALGSDEALEILKESGKANYQGYDQQMEALRADLANADDSIWEGSLYAQWLYTLNPLLVSKDDTFPEFMQSDEWDRKNLQTYQGSYTELKHDTILYSKQVLAEMGGGPINHDDRGYVEPEPELYKRLGNLAQTTITGLERYGAISSSDKEEMQLLVDICSKLETMSIKELSGTELSSEEYEFIKSYGGQLEHFWSKVNNSKGKGFTASTLSPAALVADIATNATDGTCLELGIGKVNKIYVLVPINGELHLTCGGVFSDYEFEVPISERLNDSEWRNMLDIGGSYAGKAPSMVPWVSDFTVTQ